MFDILQNSPVVESLSICHSAEEALEIILITPEDFDLVAIDHDLPKLSGPEFCRQLLGREVTLPLVLLAPENFETQLDIALRSRIASCLLKPTEKE